MPKRSLFAAPLACLALLLCSRPAAAQFSIVDLGAINGGADSSANRVNNAGHVVGGAYDSQGLQHAVMWINGSPSDLGSLCPSCGATALGVNDLDQAVGIVTLPGNQAVGALWDANGIHELSPLPGDAQSYAYAINNAGVAVGQSVSSNGTSTAVRWVGGLAESLGTLGGPFGAAFDVNDVGQIVGYSDPGNGGLHPFIWQFGSMTDLGGPSSIGPCGDIGAAQGINANGVVVGYTVENCVYTGFQWFNGVRSPLPQLAPGNPYSIPVKINSNGDIVGMSTNDNGATRAALWHNGGVTNLGALVSTSLATDINDDGLIVGRSQMPPNGANERGVEFVPLPPDTTPPTSTLTPFPQPNANGWYQFGPSIQIQAFDDPSGQGVQSISYTLSGAQNDSQTFFGSFASFNVFNPGITTVTYHATDNAGNVEGSHTFTVRIDNQQPIVSPISNITVNATSASGAVVNFTVIASDSPSGIASIVASPKASGSTFPHGTTSETVTVTDNAGNFVTRFFTVTVNKSLVSIAVNPSAVSVDVGQSQQFQAQGLFTDGSTLILTSGGGGGTPAGTGTIWNLHFDNPLAVGQCGSGASFSSQAIALTTPAPASVNGNWGTPPSVHVTGTVTATEVSLLLECINGSGSPGSLYAPWTGTRYEGTWSFSGTTGHVTVRGWSPKAPAPTPRFSIGAGTVNGVVYVMGRDNPSQPSPVEAYDIASNTWATVSTMPTSREGAAYAVLNGKIYAAGGHVAGGAGTNTMDVYDPATNTWAPAANMQVVRAQFTLVAAPNGKLYAIGGETGTNGAPLTSSVEAYDPATDTWSPMASMSAGRRFHVAGVLTFSTGLPTIVVAGGSGSGPGTEYYTIGSNTWSLGISAPTPIAGGQAVVINNAMFVVGGTANGGTSKVQMFRPGNGGNPAGWAVPGDMPTPRGELAVAAAGGSSDVLFAIGGLRNGSPVSNVEAMSTPPPFDLSVGGSGGGGGGFVPPTVSWSSSNPSVGSVNSNGQALSLNSGQTTIIATAGSISCQTTNSCGAFTVNQPTPTDCAHIVLTVTPVGSLPFSTIDVHVDGESDTHQAPFGQIEFDAGAGSYTFHFFAPSGYRVTPATITFTVACGGTAHLNVTVEADDHTPPTLTVSPNVTAQATSSAGATVTFAAPSATDASGVASVSCDRSSGDVFPIATTTVHCQATDNAGNQSTASFTVSVVDTTPPSLTLPANISTNATSPAGASVSFTATASDIVDGDRPVTCSPASGSVFGVGVTTVNCSASDTHGNVSSGSFTVTVFSASQIVTELVGDIDNFQQATGLLNNVLTSLANSNTSAACNQLSAFISQVQAQAGKKLTQAEAAELIQAASAARAALGCQ